MSEGMMLAARIYGQKDLRVEKIPIPELNPYSIRVKVKACAICGTDKRIYNIGDFRCKYPVTIGHEISAVIDAIGDKAQDKGLKVGDRVVVIPGFGCGKCRNCLAGHLNCCLDPQGSMGYGLDGGFAEYLDVPQHIYDNNFVIKIPDGLDDDCAALTEIIACANNAQNNVKVRKGDHVLIFGAGPAGIIHAHLSKMYGAEKVTLTQRSRFRLDQAKELFPDAVDDIICQSEEEKGVKEVYLERNGNRAPDVILVCAPSREAQEIACDMVAPCGRVNFFAGVPRDDTITKINANDLHYKEYMISGASSSLPSDNKMAMDVLLNKVIDGNKMITHRFPLEKMQEALELAQGRDCIKIVVHP